MGINIFSILNLFVGRKVEKLKKNVKINAILFNGDCLAKFLREMLFLEKKRIPNLNRKGLKRMIISHESSSLKSV
jgi:hypothetical protein